MSTYELKSCLEGTIPENELIDVVEKAKDWALMHGAALRSKTNFSQDVLQVRQYIGDHLLFISVRFSGIPLQLGGSVHPAAFVPAPARVRQVSASAANTERADA